MNMTKYDNARGNFGPVYPRIGKITSTHGIGKQQTIQPNGFCSCAGKKGEVKYLPCNSILISKVDQGVWMQAVGASIDVEYTLEPASMSIDEEINKNNGVHWCNKQTLTPGKIDPADIFGFSAIKLTFSGDAIFYAVTR